MLAKEIINSDLKVFQLENEKIGVSQVLTLSAEEILNEKERYIETMEKMPYTADLLIRNIIPHNYVEYKEDNKEIESELNSAFEKDLNNINSMLKDLENMIFGKNKNFV